MSEETVYKAQMGAKASSNSTTAVLLITGGILLLAVNLLEVQLLDFLWPLIFVAGPGLLMLWPAYQASPERSGAGTYLAVPGAMAVTLGAILFFLNLTNHFEAMAYTWPLIAAAGIAGLSYKQRFEQSEEVSEKRWRLIRGLVLLAMGLAAFFELMIFNSLPVWWPLLLVGYGFYLLLNRKKTA